MDSSEIRRLRKESGLSVSQAARLVKVSDRTWQRYEQGTRKVPEPVIELFRIKTSRR